MTNLVLITSVINTPHKPLSYSNIRSVFDFKDEIDGDKLQDYNSTINPLTKNSFSSFLVKLNLL